MNALLPGHVRSASSCLNVSACSLALLPVAALAGCSAVLDLLQPKEKPGPNAYPAAYRTELLDYLKNNSQGDHDSAGSVYFGPLDETVRFGKPVFRLRQGRRRSRASGKNRLPLSGQSHPICRCGPAMYVRFLSALPELTAMFAQATTRN